MKLFLKGTKWVFGLTAIFIIIFLAYNIKTVPNYAIKRGYEIVWRDDYEKYNQGYCLAENRILEDEEIYKKGILQYLKNDIVVLKKVADFRRANFSGGYVVKKSEIFEQRFGSDLDNKSINYYLLSGFDSKNWYNKIISNDNINKGGGFKDMFFGDFNASNTSVEKFLTINIDDMTAGFTKPIILYTKDVAWHLFLDKAFLLNNEQGHSFSLMPIYINVNKNNKSSIEEDKNMYYHSIKNRIGIGNIEIDNCGNVNDDIEKSYESAKDFIIHGG
jgi:hypothetical protein